MIMLRGIKVCTLYDQIQRENVKQLLNISRCNKMRDKLLERSNGTDGRRQGQESASVTTVKE